MSLVCLTGANPRIPLFTAWDKEDSSESAGEVTEQLELNKAMLGTAETAVNRNKSVQGWTVLLH